jgi:CTP synthase
MLDRVAPHQAPCTIALVGKYVKLHDAYLSVIESAEPRGYETGPHRDQVGGQRDLTNQENAAPRLLADVDGIIVPGGFGDRGIEGMIQAARSMPANRTSPISACAWACRSR